MLIGENDAPTALIWWPQVPRRCSLLSSDLGLHINILEWDTSDQTANINDVTNNAAIIHYLYDCSQQNTVEHMTYQISSHPQQLELSTTYVVWTMMDSGEF